MKRPLLTCLLSTVAFVSTVAWGAQRWVCHVDGVNGSVVRDVLKLRPSGLGGLVGRFKCFPVIGRCASHGGQVDIALGADGSVDGTFRSSNGIGCVASGSATGAFVGAEAFGDYVCEKPNGVPVSGGTFDCTRRR